MIKDKHQLFLFQLFAFIRFAKTLKIVTDVNRVEKKQQNFGKFIIIFLSQNFKHKFS